MFRCPVEGVSVRSKTFKEYGFEGSKQYGKLKRRMHNIEGSELKGHYYPCTKEELEANYIEYKDSKSEYCIFLRDGNSLMQSLFKAIRNSLAHGRFYKFKHKNETYYYFENEHGYKKAQIQLKDTTLLKWIKFIEEGVQ